MIFEDMESFCAGVDEKAFAYLTGPKRGLNEDIIKRMRLFSISNPEELINYLLERYSPGDLYLAGLFNKDRNFIFFYHRIIIPYLENGEIVYLRGRIPDSHSSGSKYIGLHSFSKNLTAKRFYNRDILTKLNPGSEILIAEGEFDTMKAIQRGWDAVGLPGIYNYPPDAEKLLAAFFCICLF